MRLASPHAARQIPRPLGGRLAAQGRGADRRRAGAGRRQGGPRPGPRRRVGERGGGRRAPGRARAARGLDAEQAGRRDLDRARAGPPPSGHRPGRVEAPPLSGRPPRRRLDRSDPAHQRRRARQPAHAPALRGPAHLPCAPAPAADRGRHRPPARRGAARRRPDQARQGAPGLAPGARADDPRGPQPPGAAHGRGDRQRGGRARAGRVRPAAARRARRAARRASCARPSCAASGRIRGNERDREQALGRARRGPGGAQRRALDPGGDRGADDAR